MSNDNNAAVAKIDPNEGSEINLSTASLADPELARCPFGYYGQLRQHAPARRDPEIGYYWVTRRSDVVSSAQDAARFSSKSDLQIRSRYGAKAQKIWDDAGMAVRYTLLTADPPEHDEYRRIANGMFTPKRVKDLAPNIEAIINDLIDGFIADGKVEFMSQFASLLPATIVADEYGFPREDRAKFKSWTDGIIGLQSPGITEDDEAKLVLQVIDMFNYLFLHLEKASSLPDGKIIYDLATKVKKDGTPFTMLERAWMAVIVFIGGNETTSNMLCSSILKLATRPDIQNELRADPSKIDNFVEEILRLEPSTQALARITTENVDIGGDVIPSGADVMLCVASANRDENYWEAPDEFRLDRANARQHLTFGAGRHVCVGMHLARLELVTAIRIILERLDNIRIADPAHPPEYLPLPIFRGMADIHVAFDLIR